MNDINSVIQQLIAYHDSGRNPQQLIGMFMPNDLTQMKSQMQNMAQGRSPSQFIMQIAKQNGVSEQNLQGLARILGANK